MIALTGLFVFIKAKSKRAGAAFEHLLQRCGHSPRADPGGDGRSLPAAPRPAQQRENSVTTRVTPFPRTY